MKPKRWAKRARTIVVHLEGPNGEDLKGIHGVEIRDAKRHTARKRVLEYRDASPAMSTIMTDVQALLAKSALVADAASYEFTSDGRSLLARVAVVSR